MFRFYKIQYEIILENDQGKKVNRIMRLIHLYYYEHHGQFENVSSHILQLQHSYNNKIMISGNSWVVCKKQNLFCREISAKS